VNRVPRFDRGIDRPGLRATGEASDASYGQDPASTIIWGPRACGKGRTSLRNDVPGEACLAALTRIGRGYRVRAGKFPSGPVLNRGRREGPSVAP